MHPLMPHNAAILRIVMCVLCVFVCGVGVLFPHFSHMDPHLAPAICQHLAAYLPITMINEVSGIYTSVVRDVGAAVGHDGFAGQGGRVAGYSPECNARDR